MIFVDTHVLAWLASDDRRLTPEARELLVTEGFVISAVTAWEYADLLSRGRFPAEAPIDWFIEYFDAEVIALPAEAWRVDARLPPVHRDPIDRMLIAHAVIAQGVLATADRKMRQYPVELL